MSVAEDVAAWCRYYARRAAEGFGPVDVSLERKRARVLEYIQRNSTAAYAAIVGGAA